MIRRQHPSLLACVLLAVTPILLIAPQALAGPKPPKAGKIETWHDRSKDLAACKVFDTEPVPPGTANRLARGIRTREDDIRDAVIAAFEERGYTYDPDADEVDFVLSFMFTPPEGPRTPGQRAAVLAQTTITGQITRNTTNTLYIELRDPETDQPVWRGRTRRVLGKKKHDEKTRFEAAAQAIAAAFPPTASDVTP